MPPTVFSLRAIAHWCCVTVAIVSLGSFGGCTSLLGDFELRLGEEPSANALCAANEHRCRDDLLVVCNAARDGWDIVEMCRTPALCDAQRGTCDACKVGDYRCEANGLQACAPSESKWDTTTCLNENLCNLNTRSCRACEPGDVQCVGAVVKTCNDQQTWEVSTPCATPELCESQTRKAARCLEPVCDKPGQHLCDGKRLYRCGLGRDRRILIDECRSEALCDAAQADLDNKEKRLAHCKAPPVCEPDQWSCDGVNLRQCNASGTGFVSSVMCTSAALCNPKAKACMACKKGEFQCAGANSMHCSDNGEWVTTETCSPAGLCNDKVGQCDLPTCKSPGSATCDTSNVLHICSAELRAVPVKPPCATAALCNALSGRCDPPACELNALRCSAGNRFERCDSKTRSWVDVAVSTCTADRPCALPNGDCRPCQTGEVRCNDLDLEVCTPNGWERKDHCATPQLCNAMTDPTACQMPKCRVGEFQCEGKILRRCKDDRTGFDPPGMEFRTCGANETCDAVNGTCK